MMASEDEAVTLDAETIRHDGKPADTADPSKGNDLDMTTVRTTAATRISIALPTTTMTKGKAPAAMTMIHLHGEQREAVVATEINRRMARVKDVTLRHLHQAAPMAVAVAAAAQQDHATPWRWRRWLVGDCGALVEALRRESAWGRMRCDRPGVRSRGIYRPRTSRFVPAITTAHPDRGNPNLVARVRG
jgi:hypothetical protein